MSISQQYDSIIMPVCFLNIRYIDLPGMKNRSDFTFVNTTMAIFDIVNNTIL